MTYKGVPLVISLALPAGLGALASAGPTEARYQDVCLVESLRDRGAAEDCQLIVRLPVNRFSALTIIGAPTYASMRQAVPLDAACNALAYWLDCLF